jgi:hypothetical protein
VNPAPTFIIGGAPRSGTTFLCYALERHPDVYIAQPYLPEPKVFLGREKTRDEYRALYTQLFAPANGRRALGEKTSRYFESAESCALLKKHLPEVRILFVVREPVARAYSNYLWSTKNGLETLSFAEAIELEGQRDGSLPAEKLQARPFDYLIRGDYDVFAQRYYEAFGRAHVGFFVYEDLIDDPERILGDIQRFIGVKPQSLHANDLGVINPAREMAGPIDPEIEAELRQRMTPMVRRFQKLTGVDLTSWGYDR